MKKVFRALPSLILTIAIVCSLFVVIPAVSVAASTVKLVDLDFSTFVDDTATEPNDTTASIGNITNTGTLASSTRVVMASKARYHTNLLTLQEMWNGQGEKTYYFDYENDNDTVADKNRFRFIDLPALETRANTISVWIKYNPEDNNPVSRYRSLLDYSVNGAQKFTLRTDSTTSGNFILTNGYTYTWRTTVNQAKNEWANFVVTNPAYVNGTKEMKTYVNGTYLGSTTVSQTSGVTSAILAIAGTNPQNSQGLYYPLAMSFGEVEVYDGELSDSDIEDLYTNNAYKFEEGTAPLPDITGYSFSDRTFSCDGSSHMINVTSASNATQGVTINYTVDGAAFSGAVAAGIYDVTATITKSGYKTLTLTATMTIEAPPAPSNDLLIDLDFSTYVKDTSSTDPLNVSGSIGNVTNSGTLSSSTIVKMSSQSGRWTELDMDKESFANRNGTITTYLHRTINTNMCNDNNRFTVIEEKALEEQANTISFWINYVPEAGYQADFNILDYNATYGGEASHLFTLDQAPTNTGSLTVCGRAQTPIYKNISECIGEWTHIVLTNPAYSNGQKTMTLYVNGELAGTKEVTKPSGTLGTVKLAFGGEAAPNVTYVNWPTEFKFADVKVYSGVVEPEGIASLFNAEYNNFHKHGDEIFFQVFKDSKELSENMSESNIGAGNFTGKLTVNNPDVSEELPARLYAAVFEGANMIFAKIYDGITLMPGQVDYITNFNLNDVFAEASEGNIVSFFVWGDELKPLTGKTSINILPAGLDENGTYRLVIKPGSIPDATTLKPERFTATAGTSQLEIERTIYYPMINELHLLLKQPPASVVPVTVTASLKTVNNTPLNINTQAVILAYSETPLYEDSVKYVKLAQNGNPVTKVETSGTYTIDVGAALQGTREGTVRIRVYKKAANGTETTIDTITVNPNENDYTFEPISVQLNAGDKVYAELTQ